MCQASDRLSKIKRVDKNKKIPDQRPGLKAHMYIIIAYNEKPIIIQHNPYHTVCKVLTKILIKLGRTVNPNTQHGNGKVC